MGALVAGADCFAKFTEHCPADYIVDRKLGEKAGGWGAHEDEVSLSGQWVEIRDEGR